MRTTLSIDDALLERAKKRASERRISLGRYVDEALREYLSAAERPAKRVVLPVSPGGGLRAGVDPSSNRSLYDAIDEGGDSPR